MSLKKLINFTFVVLMSGSVDAMAGRYSEHFRYIQPGWQKLLSSDIEGCLNLWDQQSISILSESRNADAFLSAAFLQVLVTILYEKMNDDQAYESWLTAQSYFKYSKVSWNDYIQGMQRYFLSEYSKEKDKLIEEVINVRTRPIAKIKSSDLHLFIAIESAFNISQFRHPKQNLSSRVIDKNLSIPNRGLLGRNKSDEILPYQDTFKYASHTDSPSIVNDSTNANNMAVGGSNRGGTQSLSIQSVNSLSDMSNVSLAPAVLSKSVSATGSSSSDLLNTSMTSWFEEAENEEVSGVNPWLLSDNIFESLSKDPNMDVEGALIEVPPSDIVLQGRGSKLGRVEPMTVNSDGTIQSLLQIPEDIDDKNLPLNARGTNLGINIDEVSSPEIALAAPIVMTFRGHTAAKAQKKNPILASAKRAWQFFDRNLQPTGMVNASDHYDYTDIWSMGSSLAAVIAAFKLEVINQETFDDIVSRFLSTLLEMPLYRGILPNNLYHTRDATMVTPNNELSDVGSDWNAVGLGRLLIWLKILVNWYPAYADTVNTIINRFDLPQAFNDKGLHRSEYIAGVEKTAVDTSLGYAHYAQFGFAFWGHLGNVPDISTYPEAKIYTIPIHYDDNKNAHLVSDPFFLAQMEVDDLSDVFLQQSLRVYQVQKAHSFTQKKPIAFTELNLDKPPWFIYLNIFNNGEPWQALDFSGKAYPEFLAYSTHGLFMMDAIFHDSYSQQWIEKASGFGYLDYGFPSGRRYNGVPIHSYTANTNGIILQSLLYQHVTKQAFSAALSIP